MGRPELAMGALLVGRRMLVLASLTNPCQYYQEFVEGMVGGYLSVWCL